MRLKDLIRTMGMLRSKGIDGYLAYDYDEFASLPMSKERYLKTADMVMQQMSSGLTLEIGPGPARTAIETARLLGAVEVVGLDASKTMLEIARRHVQEEELSDRITFQWGNAAQLPFPDGHFDLVVSTGSLHEWKQARRLFDEIHRVLKQGGSVLIGDVRRDAPQEELDEIARAIPSPIMRWGMRHSVAEAYTKDEVAELPSQTSWSSFETVEDGVGLTITLWKSPTATSGASPG
jgi:ubiquinone/menaquinone biosynthesis C-methylase UbiE